MLNTNIEMAKFRELAEDCPWRSYLKCEVLHLAGRYKTSGGDICKPENCAIFYWRKSSGNIK